MKAEKIKIAIEKIKEASVKKLFIKVLVLLKSLRNCKRSNKGNFTLNSNSYKIMV
jgi:hypothetical protein